MASVWERIGEAAGYAIGAAIFGPSVALARRERRIMRRAFHEWLDEMDGQRLPPIVKGITRRSGSLRGTEPIPFGAELDPFEKRARVDVSLALGRDVTTEISKDGSHVFVGSTNLDTDTAQELVKGVKGSKLARLDAFTIDLRKDRLVIELPVPRDAESWRTIEQALAVLVESWSRRFSSYR